MDTKGGSESENDGLTKTLLFVPGLWPAAGLPLAPSCTLEFSKRKLTKTKFNLPTIQDEVFHLAFITPIVLG
jgi:hypothetical protein